jgi:adenine C2-methylase RlmN of 23S rRNA A2503 and tRNA A37
MTENEILEVIEKIDYPFWKRTDFWIFLVLAIGSLYASIKAFIEAKQAKIAANEAGRTVKIQTITIELSEVIQRLDRLDVEIDFSTARDLLNETNRRVRRLIAPFKEDLEYKSLIVSIITTLSDSKTALLQVKPIDQDKVVVKSTVYYSIESNFSELTGLLAELMGKFEERTIKK